MSAQLDALIPELQPFAKALVDLAGRAGVQPRVTSTLRTHSQQQRLYDAYLRGESKYPVAAPGTSAHEFGWAFDMVADSRENLWDLGTVWRSWGGLWSTSDEVHFEYPGFRVPAQSIEDLPLPKAVKVCDFISGFVPVLGEVQLAETFANMIAPLRSHPASLERQLQAWIQGPCAQLYRITR